MKGFRAGLLVEDKVIVELKSVEKLVRCTATGATPRERAASGAVDQLRRGHLKNRIERIVNGLPEYTPPSLGHSWFHSLRPSVPHQRLVSTVDVCHGELPRNRIST